MRRSQWLTFRPTLSNWRTDHESEERTKVSLESQTETFSSSPLVMSAPTEVIGLACFGFPLLSYSALPRSLFIDERFVIESVFIAFGGRAGVPIMGGPIMAPFLVGERVIAQDVTGVQTEILAHPEVVSEMTLGIGLSGFGSALEVMSEIPKSDFIQVAQVRDHWLDSRTSLSNWISRTVNEEGELVSLEFQPGARSASPLLFDGVPTSLGKSMFGGKQQSLSALTKNLYEEVDDLWDTLATEDLDPITTEGDMDEIALG